MSSERNFIDFTKSSPPPESPHAEVKYVNTEQFSAIKALEDLGVETTPEPTTVPSAFEELTPNLQRRATLPPEDPQSIHLDPVENVYVDHEGNEWYPNMSNDPEEREEAGWLRNYVDEVTPNNTHLVVKANPVYFSSRNMDPITQFKEDFSIKFDEWQKEYMGNFYANKSVTVLLVNDFYGAGGPLFVQPAVLYASNGRSVVGYALGMKTISESNYEIRVYAIDYQRFTNPVGNQQTAASTAVMLGLIYNYLRNNGSQKTPIDIFGSGTVHWWQTLGAFRPDERSTDIFSTQPVSSQQYKPNTKSTRKLKQSEDDRHNISNLVNDVYLEKMGAYHFHGHSQNALTDFINTKAKNNKRK